MNELNELRDLAYENSLIYKEKTKKIHDSKIKNRVFNVGDRVLLFNSRLKIFSGKLKTRWTGPFTIAQVFPYGTVELSSTNGPNFKVTDIAQKDKNKAKRTKPGTRMEREPTLQVALDALKLTLFYNAFKISSDVPEIYMQEFWVTVSRHHSSLRFKLNGKSHTVNIDNFRDMLKICLKLPG
ncbi:hypothetical protein Tco_0681708 [Tanacetum coccineum]|uniref:Reverse transcriptase domain-containing protein n=1 Tax=Tanacetum coccineum TaxID=301880 RepID=A0ABQ4XP31_9ASTR